MVHIIKSKTGEDILVSDIDYPFINQLYECYVDKQGYVQCKLKHKEKLGLETGKLHRVIMQPSKGRKIHVDHINGNKLDNRRENLRIISAQNNMRNSRKRNYEHMSSKYKGVSWHNKLGAWKVYIRPDVGKNFYGGAFTNEIAAANCYNYYVVKLHGEFSALNDCPYMTKDEWESFRRKKNKTSKYKGVSLIDGKWIAQICDKGKNMKIGEFKTELEAAKAYNQRALELKGNKARLNIL
jgi:hypothetical protein